MAVDPTTHIVYVGTDVGVFQSPTSVPAWTEVGPASDSAGGSSGFLPSVAVTALAIFNSGGQKLLRASTYGRGVWQFSLILAPDFQIAVSNTPITAFAGTTPTFNGTVTAVDGYSNSVTLSCTAGGTSSPSPCTPNPATLTPAATGTAFSLTTGSAIGDYNFNVQAAGSDLNHTTHVAAVNLSVVNFGLTTPSPGTVIEPPGAASSPVSFQATAQGSFNQSVTLSCSFSPSIAGATCGFTPGTVVNPTSTSPVNMTATATVPAGTAAGNYTVTLQATTPGAPAPMTASFTLAVTASQDFTLNSSTPAQTVAAGQTTSPYNLTIAPAGSAFSGVVTLSCSGIPSGAQCNFTPNPVIPGSTSVSVVLTIATNAASAGGTYTVLVTGTSGSLAHSVTVTLIVQGSFQLGISQPFSTSADAGSQQTAKVSLTPNYSGSVTAQCDASALSGQCSITPGNPIPITAGTAITLTLTLNIPNSAAPQPSNSYTINLTVADSSGQPTQTLPLPLTVIQDFAVGSLTPTTQTISSGGSASYNFSVLPVGSSFANGVNLSCSGAPVISLCSFSPSTVTPGNSSAAVVMTISTTASSANPSPHPPAFAVLSYALWLALPGLALLANQKPPGRTRQARTARFPARIISARLPAFLLWWRRQQRRGRWRGRGWRRPRPGHTARNLHHHRDWYLEHAESSGFHCDSGGESVVS